MLLHYISNATAFLLNNISITIALKFTSLFITRKENCMKIRLLAKILFALTVVFGEKKAIKLFEKLLKFIPTNR